MKKAIAVFAAIVLTVGITQVTAFAHGHNRNRSSRTTATYSLCAVENCNTVGNHMHDNVTYAGHTMRDGHDYHLLCDVSDCTETGGHMHGNTNCLPRTSDNTTTSRSNSRGGCGRC